MPLKHKRARAKYQREYMRRYRKRKAEAKKLPVPLPFSVRPGKEAAAIVRWARESLTVPPGHPRSGAPMEVPAFMWSVYADLFTPGVTEILLCIARKNIKSAAVAVLLLAYLVGPIRRAGFRAGVASVNKLKAGELKTQMSDIADASQLDGLTFRRSPAPGRVESAFGGVDILSADRSAGHSSGYDLAIIDELGLLGERDRPLVNGLRTSVSAKGGKFISLSVRGDGPFISEILKRQGDPALRVHLFEAPKGAALDDESAWHAANPGLSCGIKSLQYMRDEARRVAVTIADQSSFRALDMNQAVDPSAQLLVSLSDWEACEVDELPDRIGPCYVGYDAGGSVSMTAACGFWSQTGRFETFAAFPDTPSLKDRGEADGAGELYQRAHEAGRLQVHPGRVVDAVRFLSDLIDALSGADVRGFGCDRNRRAETAQALDNAGVTWPVHWRGTGASATADGSADVRAFQTACVTKRIAAWAGDELLQLALSESELRFDPGGNPALVKAKQNARIDIVQAGVIALGLAALARPARGPVWKVC